MTEAQTILKMIAEVDPADTGRLDEIDLAVGKYIGGNEIIVFLLEKAPSGIEKPLRQYTRSRDALKAIRPDGYVFQTSGIVQDNHGKLEWSFNWITKDYFMCEDTPFFPTEELAELHAIIQAKEHDRTTNEGAEGEK